MDGEYIYSPTSSYSTKGSSSSDDDDSGSKDSQSKASRRMSRMGWNSKGSEDKSRVSVREVKWDESVRT